MDNQNKNLLIATALSFVVILVWFLLFPPPETAVDQATAPAAEQTADAPAAVSVPGATPGEPPM